MLHFNQICFLSRDGKRKDRETSSYHSPYSSSPSSWALKSFLDLGLLAFGGRETLCSFCVGEGEEREDVFQVGLSSPLRPAGASPRRTLLVPKHILFTS
jgi:hypothetical protein